MSKLNKLTLASHGSLVQFVLPSEFSKTCIGPEQQGIASLIVNALYCKSQPVIVLGDSGAAFEDLVLELWMQLWPGARYNFSFCTGALLPQLHAGVLLDLQFVPRSISPSNLRKVAGAATVLDSHNLDSVKCDKTTDLIMEDILTGPTGRFRNWLGVVAGKGATRQIVAPLANLFQKWSANNTVDSQQLVNNITQELSETCLDDETAENILEEAFSLAAQGEGPSSDRRMLGAIAQCGTSNVFVLGIARVEKRTRELYANSRLEALEILGELLGGTLNEVGERILRQLFPLLDVRDALFLADSQPELLPTIIKENPGLACSTELWSHSRIDRQRILSAVANTKPTPEVLEGIIEAIVEANAEGVAEELFRIAGNVAIMAVLNAMNAGRLESSFNWCSALKRCPEGILRRCK